MAVFDQRGFILQAILVFSITAIGHMFAHGSDVRGPRHGSLEYVEQNCPNHEERQVSSDQAYELLTTASDRHRVKEVPPPDVRSQKVLLVLGEQCSVDIDEDLEAACFHPVASATERCMSTRLPYLRYATFDNATNRTHLGHYKLSYAAAIRRAIPLLNEKYGWSNFAAVRIYTPEWWSAMKESDIVITYQSDFAKIVGCYPNKRYILIMNNDAATLSLTLTCSYDDERIIALLAHTSLYPILENNGPLVAGRRHFAWLSKEPAYVRGEMITPAVARKIHTIIPQVFRWRYPLDCGGRREFTLLSQGFVKPIEEWLRPFEERPIDIAFVGLVTETTGTRDEFGVNAHRAKAMRAIEAINAKYPQLRVFKAGHRLTYAKFISLLRDTKVFVSPFGLGEFSGKDYEAMLAGSLVVKPYAEHLHSYPNIYDRRLVINVDINFRSLEEAIIPYLNDPKLAWERARRGLQVLRIYSEKDKFAADLDKILAASASKSVSYNKTMCHQLPAAAYDEFGERRPLLELKRAQ